MPPPCTVLAHISSQLMEKYGFGVYSDPPALFNFHEVFPSFPTRSKKICQGVEQFSDMLHGEAPTAYFPGFSFLSGLILMFVPTVDNSCPI